MSSDCWPLVCFRETYWKCQKVLPIFSLDYLLIELKEFFFSEYKFFIRYMGWEYILAFFRLSFIPWPWLKKSWSFQIWWNPILTIFIWLKFLLFWLRKCYLPQDPERLQIFPMFASRSFTIASFMFRYMIQDNIFHMLWIKNWRSYFSCEYSCWINIYLKDCFPYRINMTFL